MPENVQTNGRMRFDATKEEDKIKNKQYVIHHYTSWERVRDHTYRQVEQVEQVDI